MGKFILFLDRLINLYLYFVVMACFLSLVPNINPDFPLFHFIFKFAGFYLIPPIFGINISPMPSMVGLVLCSMGLKKIYIKFFAKKEPKIVFLSKEDFEKKFIKKEDNKNGD